VFCSRTIYCNQHATIYCTSHFQRLPLGTPKDLTRFAHHCRKWNETLRERLVGQTVGRLRLKRDGTRAETIFRLSAKRTSPFKSAGASVQSTTGSRGVRISGSNAGYIMFRGSVKSTGYPLRSPFSPSLALPCVSMCHHISTGLYNKLFDINILYLVSVWCSNYGRLS
jgi:hypothetical protein